jgi:hypothetical protein
MMDYKRKCTYIGFKLPHSYNIYFYFVLLFHNFDTVINKEGIVGDVEVVETNNKPQSNFPLVQFP